MSNLSKLSIHGKGPEYVLNVVRAYVIDHEVKDLNNLETAMYVVREIMAGLGVFDNDLVYREAIVRKLSWIIIRMSVYNTVAKMFPLSQAEWKEGVVNTLMDNGSSDWLREEVMKIGVANLIETFAIRH